METWDFILPIVYGRKCKPARNPQDYLVNFLTVSAISFTNSTIVPTISATIIATSYIIYETNNHEMF